MQKPQKNYSFTQALQWYNIKKIDNFDDKEAPNYSIVLSYNIEKAKEDIVAPSDEIEKTTE